MVCRAHLFVHEAVYDGVVDTGALGEEGRDGDQAQVDAVVTVIHHVHGQGCVGDVAEAEGPNHHYHHAGHLPLGLLGCGGFLLLSGNL